MLDALVSCCARWKLKNAPAASIFLPIIFQFETFWISRPNTETGSVAITIDGFCPRPWEAKRVGTRAGAPYPVTIAPTFRQTATSDAFDTGLIHPQVAAAKATDIATRDTGGPGARPVPPFKPPAPSRHFFQRS
jgi:hypothetical protein